MKNHLIVITYLVLFCYVFIVLLLFVIAFVRTQYCLTFPEIFEIFSNFFQILTPIAAACIAFWVYKINKRQAKIQKGQAITQMNQAFNQINQLLIGDCKLSKIVEKIYDTKNSSEHKSSGPLEIFGNSVKEKCLIFMILNIYEAYFVNNEEIFDSNFPVILENLLRDCSVIYILYNNSYNKEFIKKCEEKCKKNGIDWDGCIK